MSVNLYSEQISYLTFSNNFIYLFLAMLGLCCCRGFSLVVVSGPYSLAVMCGASRCGGLCCCGARAPGHLGFSSCGFQAPGHWHNSCAQGLSGSVASGIFPNQGWNPCLLCWQADSLPLSHQGSTSHLIFLLYLHEGYCYYLDSAPFHCPTPPIHRLKPKFPVAQSMNDPVRN